LNPKCESVGEILAPRLSRAMSEMARWQEQEDGSEERFQHSITLAQRLVRKKGEEGFSLYL
jgi:hypothetical protein